MRKDARMVKTSMEGILSVVSVCGSCDMAVLPAECKFGNASGRSNGCSQCDFE